MNDIEITTATERASVTMDTAFDAEPTMTLSQVERLLAAATDYAKAQRPVVLYTAPMPAPAVQGVGNLPTPSVLPGNLPTSSVPRHPGIDVTVPAPPQYGVGWAPLRHRAPQPRGWGLRMLYASMATALAGAATAGATDGNTIAVAVCALGIAGAIAGGARAVQEEARAEEVAS